VTRFLEHKTALLHVTGVFTEVQETLFKPKFNLILYKSDLIKIY